MADPSVLWESISSGALNAIGAIGGFAFLAKSFFNFISSMIAKKIDAKNAKELEKLKVATGHKTYISKVRFDAEFLIYRELSSSFFDAVFQLNRIIPQYNDPLNDKFLKNTDFCEEAYIIAAEKMHFARDTLHKNAPFIDEDIHKSYVELIGRVYKQVIKFACSHNLKYSTGLFQENSLDESDAEITCQIIQKLDELNSNVRLYLNTLEVIE